MKQGNQVLLLSQIPSRAADQDKLPLGAREGNQVHF